MNKSILNKQIQEFNKDLVQSKWKIDMESRNILKSFSAIRRSSGSSDLGLPPTGRTDNIYAQCTHSKSGLRLSEKRLMEWKRRESELQRFMREMAISSGRVKGKKRQTKPRTNNNDSAKVFRLYLENDSIESKLEQRTKETKLQRLENTDVVQVPCNAYTQTDSGVVRGNSQGTESFKERRKSDNNHVSFSKLPDETSIRSPRKGPRRTVRKKDRATPLLFDRRSSSPCEENERLIRRPSSQGDNSITNFIEDEDINDISSQDSSNSAPGLKREGILQTKSEKRLTPRLPSYVKHNCIKTPPSITPRTIPVKKSKKHVHTNHLYDTYILESSDNDQSDDSCDSVFTQESVLEEDDIETDCNNVLGEKSNDLSLSEIPKLDLDGPASKLSVGKPIKQVRFSDSKLQRTKSCPNYIGLNIGTLDILKQSDKVPVQSIATQTLSIGCDYDSSSLATSSDTRIVSLKSLFSHTAVNSKPETYLKTNLNTHEAKSKEEDLKVKEQKEVSAESGLIRHQRKSQSDIFVEHPPKINSTRNVSFGSVISVAVAVSKISRKKSLRKMVEQNNPDLREAIRQERLRALEIRSNQLSQEATNFSLIESCCPSVFNR